MTRKPISLTSASVVLLIAAAIAGPAFAQSTPDRSRPVHASGLSWLAPGQARGEHHPKGFSKDGGRFNPPGLSGEGERHLPPGHARRGRQDVDRGEAPGVRKLVPDTLAPDRMRPRGPGRGRGLQGVPPGRSKRK